MNPTTTGTQLGQPNATAIFFFLLFVGVTLAITYWAARKTKTTSEFFAAGGGVSAVQNGFALAGDYMSAASFLGIAGLVATSGFDGLIYSVGWLVGWPVVPHILMRFYTVPDAKAARSSVFYATGLIGYFYLVTFILGFGASVLVGRQAITGVDKGGNMAAPMLAEVVGGTGFLGFISAVAFATILAVVAGLTLSGAAALSHDLWSSVVRKGKAPEHEQLQVARLASLVLGVLAVLLGVAFKGQNVAFMVGLAFAIAASANFPALLLSMAWKKFTTNGAVASMLTGAGSSVVLIFLSPTVQVDLLKNPTALFPLKNPGIITIPLAFAVGVLVSLLFPERESSERFAEVKHRMHVGAGRPTLPAPEVPASTATALPAAAPTPGKA